VVTDQPPEVLTRRPGRERVYKIGSTMEANRSNPPNMSSRDFIRYPEHGASVHSAEHSYTRNASLSCWSKRWYEVPPKGRNDRVKRCSAGRDQVVQSSFRMSKLYFSRTERTQGPRNKVSEQNWSGAKIGTASDGL